MVKIGLERIDTQEGIMVEALLDSGATGLVMSSEFARKQGFKLKKLERLMYIRNVDGSLNKKGPIEYTVEVNIYYQEHRERTEINVIGGAEVDSNLGDAMVSPIQSRDRLEDRRGKDDEIFREVWKTVETNAGKIGVAETKGERGKRGSRKETRKEKRKEEAKKEKMIEVRKIVEEWEIWDEEEEVAKSEVEVKKFHK